MITLLDPRFAYIFNKDFLELTNQIRQSRRGFKRRGGFCSMYIFKMHEEIGGK